MGELHPFGHEDPAATIATGISVRFEAKGREVRDSTGAPSPAPDNGQGSKLGQAEVQAGRGDHAHSQVGILLTLLWPKFIFIDFKTILGSHIITSSILKTMKWVQSGELSPQGPGSRNSKNLGRLKNLYLIFQGDSLGYPSFSSTPTPTINPCADRSRPGLSGALGGCWAGQAAGPPSPTLHLPLPWAPPLLFDGDGHSWAWPH